MSEMKNTYIDFELEDGTTVRLTLAYILLLRNKNRDPEAYREYNRVMTKGPQDELDTLRLLHMAYICGLAEEEAPMGFMEFISLCSPDREYVNGTVNQLIRPKKATASGDLSS